MLRILLLVLVISYMSTNAQSISVKIDREICVIDTLIKYNEFIKAEKNIKTLYNKLDNVNNREDFTEQLLELKYRQALIIDRQSHKVSEYLEILMEIIDDAEEKELHSLTSRIYLLIALAHEKTDKLDLTNIYLNKAHNVIVKHKLDSIYSTYCIRRSSYYRYTGDKELMMHYALKGREYGKKYNNELDFMDSYILIPAKSDDDFIKLCFMRIKYYSKIRDYDFVALNYVFIAEMYTDRKDYAEALKYCDSAYQFYKDLPADLKYYLPEAKYKIFEKLGVVDSAYHYFRQFHDDHELRKTQEQVISTKKLEEHYQNDKKEATIKNKNLQLLLIIVILSLTLGASFLLYRYSRKIRRQNITINRQVTDLSRLLEQKQVLLSELQHRVKNNLQHVISILELQKESVGFNNIEELIRENQNRIHSMALLHRKLDVSDSLNEIDLVRYVTELSGLVLNSYQGNEKRVRLDVICDIETLSIEKALPLGLIIVELISNSIKHAFKKQKDGNISINISRDSDALKNVLYYADNGPGFDFDKISQKGLGMEIIKGLIDQLDGKAESQNNNGFKLTITF